MTSTAQDPTQVLRPMKRLTGGLALEARPAPATCPGRLTMRLTWGRGHPVKGQRLEFDLGVAELRLSKAPSMSRFPASLAFGPPPGASLKLLVKRRVSLATWPWSSALCP